MDERNKGVEIKLGLFITIGLVTVAIMVVQFGKVGRSFQHYYHLKVVFSNASGLIKGADVQLAGAKVGDVDTAPQITANANGVVVGLRVFNGIKIPKRFQFQVGSTGLLGDRFVEVMPPADYDPSQYNPANPNERWGDGDRIKGVEAGGLEALTKKGEVVIDKLRDELDGIKEMTDKLNNNLLSQQNLTNLGSTFSNLRTTSANFVDASKNINTAAENVTQVIDKAKQTMTSAESAASELRTTVAEARKGGGLLAVLLSDRELANNFRALVVNLRQRGVLFYKDVSAHPGETPEAPSHKRPSPQPH